MTQSNNLRRTKSIRHFIKHKVWIALLASIIIMLVCVSNEEENKNKDIYGNYRYEETIYRNPLSSQMAINTPKYIIKKNNITKLQTFGSEEKITASLKKSELNEEAFKNMFMPEVGVPDISNYKQCYQYSINERYCLYVLDDEVWLVEFPNGTMWSIIRIVKIKQY